MNMKEEIQELWGQLPNKSAFAFRVAPLVDRSKWTVYRHWFSKSTMSPGLPNDPKTLKILLRELKKELENK